MAIDAKREYEFYIEEPSRTFERDQMNYINPVIHEHVKRYGYDGPESIPELANILRARQPNDQLRLDSAMWYGALTQGGGEKVELLKRVFTTIYNGGLLYQSTSGWEPWAFSNLPIASALSRGGRILIILPKAVKNEDDGFFNWLGGGEGGKNLIKKNARFAATHGIDVITAAEMRAMASGRILRLNESKKDHNKKHYGINIALGGENKRNPLSNQLIHDDGEHGHLYIYYLRPTYDTYGGLLIGCEGSAPIDRWENRKINWLQVGLYFAKEKGLGGLSETDKAKFPPDQTGGRHTFGERQEFGPTGGRKWERLPHGPRVVYNGVVLDLVPTGWEFLRDLEFDPENIGNSGIPPAPAPPWVMPSIFTKTSITSGHLNQMKAINTTLAKDFKQISKGKTPVNKLDVNAITKVGKKKVYRPKTTEELNPTISSISRNIEPDGLEVLSVDQWKSFSWLRFGGRKNVVLVDNKLKDYIDFANDAMKDFRLRGDKDIPGAMDTKLMGRIFACEYLAIAASNYIKTGGGRAAAVKALHMLVLNELKKLKDARKKLPDYNKMDPNALTVKNLVL